VVVATGSYGGRVSGRPFRGSIRVRPGASRTAVGGQYGEPPALVVRVTARAADGRANAAVVVALAQALGVPRSRIAIVAGRTARSKVVEIADPPADLAHGWAGLLQGRG
jgi:uncharacterized protein